jgi:ectoine hydroxylase-related dioxygenase (phytanoyl-CoA dioxygenase family)
MTIRHYGVTERNAAQDEIDVSVEELECLGYTVVGSGYSAVELEQFRSALDELLARHIRSSGGSEALERIGEGDQVRAPLAQDPAFLRVAINERVLRIVGRVLGNYFILNQQNGVINRPSKGGHHQAAYHRDLPYQHFVSSRPIAVSALLCIDPFSREMGSTRVLAGSHRYASFPSDHYVSKNEISITAPAGAFIIMDAMLYHRAGDNSSSVVRRAVNNVYSLAFVKQQIVLPAALNGKWRDEPTLSRLLGYDSDPPRSVAQFMLRRAQRANVGAADRWDRSTELAASVTAAVEEKIDD